jgi:hypothetical protein
MAEYGFMTPDGEYIQTPTEPTQEMLDGFPAGTVAVPLKPGDGWTWNGEAWVAPAAAMAEQGFMTPDGDYIQTLSEPGQDVLAGFPAGTVAVPLKPGDGWTWDGAAWVAPDADFLADRAMAAVAARRYAVETGGITVGGAEIETNRRAQGQLSATLAAFNAGMVSSVDWKAGNGWQTLDLAGFAPIAEAVAAHVQDCFSAERAADDDIAAMAAAELDTLDPAALFDAKLAAITAE